MDVLTESLSLIRYDFEDDSFKRCGGLIIATKGYRYKIPKRAGGVDRILAALCWAMHHASQGGVSLKIHNEKMPFFE